jgi:hypothetical protein
MCQGHPISRLALATARKAATFTPPLTQPAQASAHRRLAPRPNAAGTPSVAPSTTRSKTPRAAKRHASTAPPPPRKRAHATHAGSAGAQTDDEAPRCQHESSSSHPFQLLSPPLRLEKRHASNARARLAAEGGRSGAVQTGRGATPPASPSPSRNRSGFSSKLIQMFCSTGPLVWGIPVARY